MMGQRRFLQERFGFTRSEIVTIVFLSSSLLCGAAVRRWAPPPAMEESPTFDFSRDDSIYAARSQTAADTSRRAYAPGGDAHQPRKALPGVGAVNINTAKEDQLRLLPGVGPAIAGRIIAYRKDHGPFTKQSDIGNVKGIGPKKLERILPYVVIR